MCWSGWWFDVILFFFFDPPPPSSQVFVEGTKCKKVKKTQCKDVVKKDPVRESVQTCNNVPYQVTQGCQMFGRLICVQAHPHYYVVVVKTAQA